MDSPHEPAGGQDQEQRGRVDRLEKREPARGNARVEQGPRAGTGKNYDG